MIDTSILAPFVADDPDNYAELVSSCGKFIDTWLDAGGEPTDDLINGFYGIWGQSLDVERGEPDRAKNEAEFYAFFYPDFIEMRDALRNQLGTAQALR